MSRSIFKIISRGCRTHDSPFVVLFGSYFDQDIAGACGDLTFAARCRLGDMDVAGRGLGSEDLVGQQRAGHVAGAGVDGDIGGVAAVEFHVARGRIDLKELVGDRIAQRDIARRAFGGQVGTGELFQLDVAGIRFDRYLSRDGGGHEIDFSRRGDDIDAASLGAGQPDVARAHFDADAVRCCRGLDIGGIAADGDRVKAEAFGDHDVPCVRIDLQRGIRCLRQVNRHFRTFGSKIKNVLIPLACVGRTDHELAVLHLNRMSQILWLRADDLALLFVGGRDLDIRDRCIDGDLVEGAADLIDVGLVFRFAEAAEVRAARRCRAYDNDRTQHDKTSRDDQPYFSCSFHCFHPFP